MGPELRRHLGADAEPALEARNGLVKQHAEPIDDPVSPGARGRQQLGLERAVDDIGDDGICRQRRKIDVERVLAGHAEAGRIDEQAAARKRSMPVLPVDHLDGRPEGLSQRLGAVARAVGEEDARGALVEKAVQDRPRRPAGAEHHHGPPPLIPVRAPPPRDWS